MTIGISVTGLATKCKGMACSLIRMVVFTRVILRTASSTGSDSFSGQRGRSTRAGGIKGSKTGQA